jgi:hypothetical protein
MPQPFKFPPEYLNSSEMDFINKFIELVLSFSDETIIYSDKFYVKSLYFSSENKAQLQIGTLEGYHYSDCVLHIKNSSIVFLARWDNINKCIYDEMLIKNGHIESNISSFILDLKKIIKSKSYID